MDTFLLRDDFRRDAFNIGLQYFEGFAVLHIGCLKTRYSDIVRVDEIPDFQQAFFNLTIGAPLVLRKCNNKGVLISKVVIKQFEDGYGIRIQRYRRKGSISFTGSHLSEDEMFDLLEAIDNIGLID